MRKREEREERSKGKGKKRKRKKNGDHQELRTTYNPVSGKDKAKLNFCAIEKHQAEEREQPPSIIIPKTHF